MSFYSWLRSRTPLTHKGFQNRMDLIQQQLNIRFEDLFDKGNNIQSEITALHQIEVQIEKQQNDLKMQQGKLLNYMIKMQHVVDIAARSASENVWSSIFNQTIDSGSWLYDHTFSPGRWAVGYQYLYVMFRILNEVHPHKILELGLGQSTKMIAQYAKSFPDVSHQVVEHDSEWISFFVRNFALPINTKVIQLQREFVPYKDAHQVRVFKGFKEKFQNETFDFISIDAPLGGDMKQYARIDVLQMMPQILATDFIIMIDDCNRPGEQHTVRKMEEILQKNKISYSKGIYSGDKDCVVLAAESRKFVCSM